jgi:tetratricopeptide (TPR) repeat protein
LVGGVQRGASVNKKDLDEARALAAQIAQRRPRWANGFALNGQIAEIAGSADQAIENYQHAIELGNVQPWLVRRLVSLLDQRKRFDEIERLAQLLRDQETARGEITIVRAVERQYLAQFLEYWIGRNQFDRVEHWLAELKKADRQGLMALQLEARLLDIRKRKAELRSLLTARGRESPDQIGAVADLLDRYGFTQEAEDAYKAFIARDPKQPERALPFLVATAALRIYDARSVNDAQRRQVAEWVAEVVEQRPEAVVLADKLGVIRVRQGRFDEAETLFRRLLSRNPANSEALNNLAWLLALRDHTKATEAIALVDRAAAIAGEVPNLADTRALARIQLGEFDRAVTDLLEIRRKSPGNPSFALHLAWAYHAMGKSEQARKELREAETLGLRPAVLDPLELDILKRLQKL